MLTAYRPHLQGVIRSQSDCGTLEPLGTPCKWGLFFNGTQRFCQIYHFADRTSVEELNEEYSGGMLRVNPIGANDPEKQLVYIDQGRGAVNLTEVRFDVQLHIAESQGGGGRLAVAAAFLQAEGGKKKETENALASRVQFSVPVILPYAEVKGGACPP